MRNGMIGLTGLTLACLVGCGGGEGGGSAPDAAGTPAAPPAPAAATTAPDAAATAGDAAAEQAREQAAAAIEAIREQYTSRLNTETERVEALKASAKAVEDERLDEIIMAIEGKLGEARAMLDSLRDAAPGTTDAIEQQLASLLDQAGGLYDDAKARLGDATKGLLPEGTKLPGFGGG